MLNICQKAPEIEGWDIINEKTFKLSNYKGEFVLVGFNFISSAFDTDDILIGGITGEYYLPKYFIKTINYLQYPLYSTEALSIPIKVVLIAAPDSNYQTDNYKSFTDSLRSMGIKISIIVDVKPWNDYKVTMAPLVVVLDKEHKVNNIEKVSLLNVNTSNEDYRYTAFELRSFIYSRFREICPSDVIDSDSKYMPSVFDDNMILPNPFPVSQDSEK